MQLAKFWMIVVYGSSTPDITNKHKSFDTKLSLSSKFDKTKKDSLREPAGNFYFMI